MEIIDKRTDLLISYAKDKDKKTNHKKWEEFEIMMSCIAERDGL